MSQHSASGHCFHCHLPIKGPPPYRATIEEVEQPMCCPGCKMVAEAIMAGGLDNYYWHRTDPGLKANTLSTQRQEELHLYDRDDIQQDFVISNGEPERQASLLIEGITCAACVWLLENHIGLMAGVERVSVNLGTHEAQVSWNNEQVSLSQILVAIHQVGYQAHPWRADRQEAMLKEENRVFIRRLAIAGIGTMQVMMYAIALYSGALSHDMADPYRDLIRYVSALVATPVIFYSAAPFFKAAIRDARTRHLSMDVPVSMAIGGAYIASLWATLNRGGEVYFDSVSMLTFFLLTGRYLELRVRQANSRAARTLSNRLPSSCLRKTGDDYVRIPVKDLKTGDQVRVLPGDSIPADGVILTGDSSVDESMLTGEYLPIARCQGEPVIGGSLNIDNTIEVEITHVGDDARMSAILKRLKQAQQDKPAMAKLADRIASYFVALVLITATVVYWYWSGVATENAFWITLSVLVVTCPCALSLATPTALTAATGYLHKLGFLVTRGHVLEGLGKITHIVFDKTGTLTQGRLTLEGLYPVADCPMSGDELLAIASAIEAHSEHPIARAFAVTSHLKAEEVISHIGKGIEARVAGHHYQIGRPDFCCQDTLPVPPGAEGQWLLMSENGSARCWFKVTDSLRPEASAVVRQLQDSGFRVTLLSGDQESVVASVARQLGIEQWHSRVSPDDKLAFIRQRQAKGERVLMVGEGINDVPVLAGADISLAMGHASDLAKTSADAILLADDLGRLTDAFALVQRTHRIIRQNLAWSLGYNMTALPLAAAAVVTPWMAAIGMALSSLVVVSNATRLGKMSVSNISARQSADRENADNLPVAIKV